MTISTYIERDMEARIRSGEFSDVITISSMAEHYSVSFSPVRVAIVIEVEQPLRQRLDVLDGIEQVATALDWETTLIPVPDFGLSSHRRWAFDGMVGRIGKSLAAKAKRRKISAVNVWLNTDAKGLPGVFPDWTQAGKMAARHLVSLGFRRLAYVGFKEDIGVVMQIEGFDSIAQDMAAHRSVHLLERKYSISVDAWESFSEELDQFVDALVSSTGVCVSDDFLSRFIIERCVKRGLRIPQDIAIVSMENEPLVCEFQTPRLSSIDVGYKQVGMQAALRLERIINGQENEVDSIWLPPREIVERQSTDAFGVDDPSIEACLRYIAKQAHRQISVDDVAQQSGMSRRSLERRFKEVVCHTVGEEITRRRLELAKRKLFDVQLPIKSIARQSGFRDSSQLCAVFQRELGMSPGQFRKIHAENHEA
ncbi:AraC family transcriptional regulator [Novipirellula artificiosorum]|uniref:Xylose operon regulatory protein n=1 Tax=Novipirellula artificiosorum TaxID=2528016 RepID=A0A5C6CTT0_9BACT|nr:substrate-binding domain-containing protein [Novipirellula artificiosorum]TWU28020.1 Xylose operon regulatory protein [Novipirellula artificiosorum]